MLKVPRTCTLTCMYTYLASGRSPAPSNILRSCMQIGLTRTDVAASTFRVAQTHHSDFDKLRSLAPTATNNVVCFLEAQARCHRLWRSFLNYSTFLVVAIKEGIPLSICTRTRPPYIRLATIAVLYIQIFTFPISQVGVMGQQATITGGLGLKLHPLWVVRYLRIYVCRLSSFSVCLWRTALITFLTVRIQCSQTPPWCEAPGGLKIHLMFLSSRTWCILLWFQLFMQPRNSFSLLTKFLPLSDLISSGFPLLAMKRLMAFRNEWLSRLDATSIWMARIVRHVSITPYLLTILCPRRTLNAPKQSTPVKVKGGFDGVTWLFGRSAIFCSATRGLSAFAIKAIVDQTWSQLSNFHYPVLVSYWR